MGKSRKEITKQFPTILEMYNRGNTIPEIAEFFKVSKESIYNAFTIHGMSLKKRIIDESKLIYADNRIILEKIVINGKRYIDVTPLCSPR